MGKLRLDKNWGFPKAYGRLMGGLWVKIWKLDLVKQRHFGDFDSNLMDIFDFSTQYVRSESGKRLFLKFGKLGKKSGKILETN